MPPNNEQEKLTKLIGLIQEALQRDEQLRQTYQIGERFRFIRDRLQVLLEKIKSEALAQDKKEKQAQEVVVQEDELLVYIHLYNAQGIMLRTWQSMINPRAFFDFSVNRPLYQEKAFVEAFIRSKANQIQHAYLIVAMKRDRVLPATEAGIKDILGSPLIKIKEGSLHYDRAVAFVHNEQVYVLSEGGELVKKSSASVAVK